MNYLYTLKKDKQGMFWFSCITIFAVIFAYPFCIKNVYEYLFVSTKDIAYSIFQSSLLVCVLAVPSIILVYLPRVFQYFYILKDIKKGELVEEIIVSLKKPETTLFDRYIHGTKDENDLYYMWTVRTENGHKMKLLYFKNVFSFKGKTIGHKYKVICYKYSKVIINVEKCI